MASKSVLNSGKQYSISPKDGTKAKTSVSEAFRTGSGDQGKVSPLIGGGEKTLAGVDLHKPDSWVKGGAKGKPAGPSDPSRKKVSYGS